MALWRAYELMESQAGNLRAAQNVYQRSIRDAIAKDDYPNYESQNLVSICVLEDAGAHCFFIFISNHCHFLLDTGYRNSTTDRRHLEAKQFERSRSLALEQQKSYWIWREKRGVVQ